MISYGMVLSSFSKRYQSWTSQQCCYGIVEELLHVKDYHLLLSPALIYARNFTEYRNAKPSSLNITIFLIHPACTTYKAKNHLLGYHHLQHWYHHHLTLAVIQIKTILWRFVYIPIYVLSSSSSSIEVNKVTSNLQFRFV